MSASPAAHAKLINIGSKQVGGDWQREPSGGRWRFDTKNTNKAFRYNT